MREYTPPPRWTEEEDRALCNLRKAGLTFRQIAERLGSRSLQSTKNRYCALGMRPLQDDGDARSCLSVEAARIGCQRLHEAHMRVHGGWKTAA